MTCNGCKTNVENALSNLKEVTKVEAFLKEKTVAIEMSSHISIEKLQETLLNAGLHYTIEMPGHKKHKEVKVIEEGNGVHTFSGWSYVS